MDQFLTKCPYCDKQVIKEILDASIVCNTCQELYSLDMEIMSLVHTITDIKLKKFDFGKARKTILLKVRDEISRIVEEQKGC